MSNLDGLSDIEGSLDPVLFAVTSNPVYTISVISVYADDIAQIVESLTALRKGLCLRWSAHRWCCGAVEGTKEPQCNGL